MNEQSRADKIREQQLVIENNIPTPAAAREALEHHREQLRKMGATLEDDVCMILYKAVEAAEAYELIKKYRNIF